jgi:hypothetical protein
MYTVQRRLPRLIFDRDEAEANGKICNSMNVSGAVCRDGEYPRAPQHIPQRLQPASSNTSAVNACSLTRDRRLFYLVGYAVMMFDVFSF